MFQFAVRRLLWSIPVLLIASILVFITVKATTDPSAVRGPGVRAEDIQRLKESMGLNRPPTGQYLSWLGNFVQGDLGTSLKSNQPIWPDLKTAIWNTIQLGSFAWLLLGCCLSLLWFSRLP